MQSTRGCETVNVFRRKKDNDCTGSFKGKARGQVCRNSLMFHCTLEYTFDQEKVHGVKFHLLKLKWRD